jgi:CO/xanthine dehydrogenase Mo-binding subunit
MAHITVGRPINRIEGRAKVSGQTSYAADFKFPDVLVGKSLRSPYAHARIVRLDADAAKRIPGVLAVLTGADLPDILTGRQLHDMPILARKEVKFIGERVAVVAAEKPEIAEAALAHIKVDYQELPALFDPVQAVQPDAPILHPKFGNYRGPGFPPTNLSNLQALTRWELGNVAEGFKQSDFVFEHTFHTQYVHQGYIEPHAAVVKIDGEGKAEIWASNKLPYDLKRFLCDATGLSSEKVTVHVLAIGGDFGGKGALMDVPLCYYLALATGRPVKMVMTYAEELMAGNPRHPSVMTMKTGVTKEGVMLARHAALFWNGGAYGAMKPNPAVNLQGASLAAGPYKIPHVSIESHVVYTNCVPCGHFRAPGHPQVTFAGECQIDIIAEALRMDPLEFRVRNALQAGNPIPAGRSMSHISTRKTLHAVARASGWKNKPKAGLRSGMGIAASYRGMGTGDANARITAHPDGTVSLLTTYTDPGMGCHTVMCQIVAEVLGVPFDQIRLEIGSTDTFVSESGTGASRVTYVLGQVTHKAASEVKALLQRHAMEWFQCEEPDVVFRAGRFSRRNNPRQSISIAQLAAGAAREGKTIEVQSYFSAKQTPAEGSVSAAVAQVKVDVETGSVRVLKVTTAHDVGTVLNPLTHQGQIDGSIVQGVGFALTEEMQSEAGNITTLNLGEYKLPNIKDIPALRTVLVQESSGPAPFEGKEIGESPIAPIAAAIANAVYDAVGVRIFDLPITAEKLHCALQLANRS